VERALYKSNTFLLQLFTLTKITIKFKKTNKIGNLTDIYCIIQDASNEAAKYPSGRPKKEILVYDNSFSPGKTLSDFDFSTKPQTHLKQRKPFFNLFHPNR
jgi:hypothetical protein